MSFSDVSDLTELSSEEERTPIATNTTRTKKQPKEYKILHVLRAPRTTQYTAKSLYDQIIDNAVDLDPEYQRDVVWSEEKQSGLIDSILRNYYIPPIIFAVSFQEDGSEMRTCIDGKQRLTSIQKFLDGQIPHKDSFTNEKLWYKSSAQNPRRKILPQHLRTLFTNKQVVCVEYSDLNGDQEREIFQRVQMGVALTPAERLQAIVGPWPSVIRDIQSHVLGEEGFHGYLDWGHTRGRDFQCLATIGHFIENYPKATIPNAKMLEKWLHSPKPVDKKLVADLHDTFRIFLVLARDKQYSGSLNRPTRVSPIEFVMIGVMIYLKKMSLSLTQLSSAIEKMRKDVRASEKDIRANNRVAKLMIDFMNKRLKVSELKKDGQGDIPAIIAVKSIQPSLKRKRPADDERDVSVELPRKTAAKTFVAANPNSIKTDGQPIKPLPAKRSPLPNHSPIVTTASVKSNSPNIPATLPALPQSVTQAPNLASSAQSPTFSTSSMQPTSMQSTVPPVTTGLKLLVPNPIVQAPPVKHVVRGELPGPPSSAPPCLMNPSSVSSPSPTNFSDRLAPIRAAKASLLGHGSHDDTSSTGTENGGGGNVQAPPMTPTLRQAHPSLQSNLGTQSVPPSQPNGPQPQGMVRATELMKDMQPQNAQTQPGQTRQPNSLGQAPHGPSYPPSGTMNRPSAWSASAGARASHPASTTMAVKSAAPAAPTPAKQVPPALPVLAPPPTSSQAPHGGFIGHSGHPLPQRPSTSLVQSHTRTQLQPRLHSQAPSKPTLHRAQSTGGSSTSSAGGYVPEGPSRGGGGGSGRYTYVPDGRGSSRSERGGSLNDYERDHGRGGYGQRYGHGPEPEQRQGQRPGQEGHTYGWRREYEDRSRARERESYYGREQTRGSTWESDWPGPPPPSMPAARSRRWSSGWHPARGRERGG